MKHLAAAVVEAMAFLELSGDDVIDPDSAVSATEMIAAELKGCSEEEVEALRKVSRRLAAKAKGRAKEFYQGFLKAAGLEEADDDDVDELADEAWKKLSRAARDLLLNCGANGGDVTLARRLLEQDPSLVRAKDGNGSTGLHLASRYGHAKIIKLLLEAGANTNARDSGGDTPLHMAAYKGTAEPIELLLDAGAEMDLRNKRRLTPRGILETLGGSKKAKEAMRQRGAKV